MTDLAEIDLETARMTRGNFDVLAGDPSKRAYLPLSYRTYLRAASGYSLRTSTCSEEFAKRLEEFDPLPVLRSLLDIADSGEWPSLFSRFNAFDVDLIAIPVLLNSPSLAVRYLESCLLRSTSVPLWNTYVDGLASLVRGTSFEPTYPKQPKGLEKHWVLYIRLMATIRHEQSIDGICCRGLVKGCHFVSLQ